MDTPERNQIGTPLSKFEDSPVFNYINSLSPIKPVKSVNISQTFNSLSFPAIPSVFTSPHVKEFRFLRRHQITDQSKNGNSLDCGNNLGSKEGTEDAPQLSVNVNVPQGSSLGEAAPGLCNEEPNLTVPLSRSLSFDCCSPDSNPKPCCTEERNDLSEPFVQSESAVCKVSQSEQKIEESICDWGRLISDAADALIYSSPDGTETLQEPIQRISESGTDLCASLLSEFPEDGIACDGQYFLQASSMDQTADPSGKLKETDQACQNLANTSPKKSITSQQDKKKDDEAGKFIPLKSIFNMQRGVRRRCLVFEMTGAHRKKANNTSNIGSSSSLQSDGNIASTRRILPGIGLHLNSLATTPKDHKVVKNETMAAESPLIDEPSSVDYLHSPSLNTVSAASSLALICSESNDNEFYGGGEILLSSPKKKRRKIDQAGEIESCKRCNCKKSKCLKLYCECFAAGVYCVEPCSCQECFNKPVHEDTVLATRKQIESRNPLAFAPKVIRSADSTPEIGDQPNKTPASARHKRGCNCKKSSCLKKYCECYQGGVGCSIGCRCEGCKNVFGRKDGSAGTDDEQKEETESSERTAHLDTEKIFIETNEKQYPDTALTMTPLKIDRSSAQLPFSSKRKPPRSSLLASGSSSLLLHAGGRIGKPNFVPSQPNFGKHFKTDEIPDILLGNCSPSTVIKTASPNSKRVSPPHNESSPSLRSSRKLILRSIPSFPSLTQN